MRQMKTLKGFALFDFLVLLRNLGVCEANFDEKIGRNLYRAGVRRHFYRWESVDQRVESQNISAELVAQRRAIDGDNIHDARPE
jgi:hypothetical protein